MRIHVICQKSFTFTYPFWYESNKYSCSIINLLRDTIKIWWFSFQLDLENVDCLFMVWWFWWVNVDVVQVNARLSSVLILLMPIFCLLNVSIQSNLTHSVKKDIQLRFHESNPCLQFIRCIKLSALDDDETVWLLFQKEKQCACTSSKFVLSNKNKNKNLAGARII